MPQLFHNLAFLAALVSLAVIAFRSLALDAGDDLTADQARVLCAAIQAIEHVAIAYGALAAQDAPLTLAAKAMTLLLG
ncbi:hypothetical protein [Streptomyces sp. NL15-2K]|uniref:hypothetical protein n=1 Tax=Streptomyces sp. NL15-2K TaxID=376149 RepID=UPI000FF9EABB|nr:MULTISPECIES: hypothetical protein [Actinomycetes]WKX07375.1 hypothetical protein Q4V64_07700 [Kutzneria buriramensis]GCB51390.1 hypothetical protein SNL152K_8746 [Streptomyces sp. NL15-2K]